MMGMEKLTFKEEPKRLQVFLEGTMLRDHMTEITEDLWRS